MASTLRTLLIAGLTLAVLSWGYQNCSDPRPQMDAASAAQNTVDALQRDIQALETRISGADALRTQDQIDASQALKGSLTDKVNELPASNNKTDMLAQLQRIDNQLFRATANLQPLATTIPELESSDADLAETELEKVDLGDDEALVGAAADTASTSTVAVARVDSPTLKSEPTRARTAAAPTRPVRSQRVRQPAAVQPASDRDLAVAVVDDAAYTELTLEEIFIKYGIMPGRSSSESLLGQDEGASADASNDPSLIASAEGTTSAESQPGRATSATTRPGEQVDIISGRIPTGGPAPTADGNVIMESMLLSDEPGRSRGQIPRETRTGGAGGLLGMASSVLSIAINQTAPTGTAPESTDSAVNRDGLGVPLIDVEVGQLILNLDGMIPERLRRNLERAAAARRAAANGTTASSPTNGATDSTGVVMRPAQPGTPNRATVSATGQPTPQTGAPRGTQPATTPGTSPRTGQPGTQPAQPGTPNRATVNAAGQPTPQTGAPRGTQPATTPGTAPRTGQPGTQPVQPGTPNRATVSAEGQPTPQTGAPRGTQPATTPGTAPRTGQPGTQPVQPGTPNRATVNTETQPTPQPGSQPATPNNAVAGPNSDDPDMRPNVVPIGRAANEPRTQPGSTAPGTGSGTTPTSGTATGDAQNGRSPAAGDEFAQTEPIAVTPNTRVAQRTPQPPPRPGTRETAGTNRIPETSPSDFDPAETQSGLNPDESETSPVRGGPGGEGNEAGTESGTEQPGTNQPGTTPGTNQPGTTPGSGQPGTNQPGTTPGTNQPGTNQPGTGQPDTDPGTTQPGGTTDPGTGEVAERPIFDGTGPGADDRVTDRTDREEFRTAPAGPRTGTQPGGMTDPGTGTQPGGATDPGAGTQPGGTTDPGAGTQPGGTTDPATIRNELADSADNLENLQDAEDQARQDLANATTPEERQAADDRIAALQAEIARLRERIAELEAQLANLRGDDGAQPGAGTTAGQPGSNPGTTGQPGTTPGSGTPSGPSTGQPGGTRDPVATRPVAGDTEGRFGPGGTTPPDGSAPGTGTPGTQPGDTTSRQPLPGEARLPGDTSTTPGATTTPGGGIQPGNPTDPTLDAGDRRGPGSVDRTGPRDLGSVISDRESRQQALLDWLAQIEFETQRIRDVRGTVMRTDLDNEFDWTY